MEWFNNVLEKQASDHITGQPGSTVKQVPCRPDSSLKQELRARNLWLIIKMMASPYEIDTFLCTSKTIIFVRHSRSIEERETGKQFMPQWRAFADELRTLVPEGDDKGSFVVPALDTRSQVLSIKDRRNSLWKTCVDRTFVLVSPDLYIPRVSDEVLQRVLTRASGPRV